MTDCVKFPVYMDRSRRQHYRTFVFRTKEIMLQFWKAQTKLCPSLGKCGRLNWEAQCTGWRSENKNGQRTNCVGQILFYTGNMGAGIVSHEMTHAANYFLSRRGVKFSAPKGDERLAWTQGYLVWQFWQRYFGKTGDRIREMATTA